MQAEFEALLGQRSTATTSHDLFTKDSSFYTTMTEFYQGHKKHESPTRRLMNQMDAACENKSVINSQLRGANYSLTYCPSPDRAYVVEPHKGELNYDDARKNLDKFYKKVMNQDITKHSLKKSTAKYSKADMKELKKGASIQGESPVSKKHIARSAGNIANLSLNKRSHNVEIETTELSRGEMFDKLLVCVTSSIYKLIKTRVQLTDEKISTALESRAVLNLVKRHMRDENIQMVDEQEKPRFKRALSLIGEERTHQMAMESQHDFEKDVDPQDLRMRVTDQVVYEVCEAVKTHATK